MTPIDKIRDLNNRRTKVAWKPAIYGETYGFFALGPTHFNPKTKKAKEDWDAAEIDAHFIAELANSCDAMLEVIEAAKKLAPIVERQTTEWIALNEALTRLYGEGTK